jgi:hypothetical protein
MSTPTEPTRLPFLLMRQDDNGNRVLMARYQDRTEAEAQAAVYEARGHKQLYWVEEEAETG